MPSSRRRLVSSREFIPRESRPDDDDDDDTSRESIRRSLSYAGSLTYIDKRGPGGALSRKHALAAPERVVAPALDSFATTSRTFLSSRRIIFRRIPLSYRVAVRERTVVTMHPEFKAETQPKANPPNLRRCAIRAHPRRYLSSLGHFSPMSIGSRQNLV